MNREDAIGSFRPFRNPGSVKGMIIGNDLDALLSASFCKHHWDWDIVGCYNLSSLWLDATRPGIWQEIQNGEILFLDLDISVPGLYSAGHHILHTHDIPGCHSHSLNPNLLENISLKNFRSKYPLGTIHFLQWIFDLPPHDRPTALLCWLADSAWILAQGHLYRDNVHHWITERMPVKEFQSIWHEADTMEFEKEMQENIISPFTHAGISSPPGRSKSRHLQICAQQYQWNDISAEKEHVHNCLKVIREITGWKTPHIPSDFFVIKGIRTHTEINFSTFNMDIFYASQKTFSCVFPYKNQVNYTELFLGPEN